jgi:hypothetical protein
MKILAALILIAMLVYIDSSPYAISGWWGSLFTGVMVFAVVELCVEFIKERQR